MPQQTIIAQHLKDELKNIPQKTRDWFSSEQIIDRIINLNKELGLGSKIEPGPKFKPASEKAAVIPLLLLRLQVKDLEPRNFTQELSSQLNVDYEIAKSIAREIKKQILEPISQALLRLGIDTNLIAIGGLNLSEIKPEIPKEEIKPEGTKLPPGAPLQSIEIESSKPAELPSIADTKTKLPDFEPFMPSESISTDKSFDKAQDKPFMIHQEAGIQPVTEKKKIAMPAIGWFKKALPDRQAGMPAGRQEKPKAPESPIKVQLETFGQKGGEPFDAAQGKEKKESITAKTEIPKQRIVHYREVETPTPFGKPGTQPLTQSPKESQPSKIETPTIKPEPSKSSLPGKPFGTVQSGPEQPTRPTEPKVIDLESFFEVTEKKENGTKNEVGLEGNTINLKNDKLKE